MFTLRFDMRTPAGSAQASDLYAAAIEMCEWAEGRGAVVAVLSEHHGRPPRAARRIVTIDEAIASIRGGRPLPLLPLWGGVPPDVAWPYLERAATASQRV